MKPLRWVLLPGLDGSGRLFGAFQRCVPDPEPIVVRYPDEPGWQLDDHVRHVKAMLPATDCIVVAESFSGPIAIRAVGGTKSVRGLVLVASFATCPHPLLRILPARLLVGLRRWLAFDTVLRTLCLGGDAPDEIVAELKRVVTAMPDAVLASRLWLLRSLESMETVRCVAVPKLLLRARHDRLVTVPLESGTCDPHASTVVIDGPHFLLQACPAECARAIEAWRRELP